MNLFGSIQWFIFSVGILEAKLPSLYNTINVPNPEGLNTRIQKLLIDFLVTCGYW